MFKSLIIAILLAVFVVQQMTFQITLSTLNGELANAKEQQLVTGQQLIATSQQLFDATLTNTKAMIQLVK